MKYVTRRHAKTGEVKRVPASWLTAFPGQWIELPSQRGKAIEPVQPDAASLEVATTEAPATGDTRKGK